MTLTVPKIITIGRLLFKLSSKTQSHGFFETQCIRGSASTALICGQTPSLCQEAFMPLQANFDRTEVDISHRIVSYRIV